MPSPKNLFIFDFDGTLAHTLPSIFATFNAVFREFGERERSPEDIEALFGPTEEGSLDLVFPNDPRREAIIERYYAAHREILRAMAPSADAVRSLLDALVARGGRLAICTGKARRSLEDSLSLFFPGVDFAATISGDDTACPKPDPEGLRKILAQTGTSPEDALFLGDSLADVRAGRAAGVETWQVDWWGTASVVPAGEEVPRFARVEDARPRLLERLPG